MVWRVRAALPQQPNSSPTSHSAQLKRQHHLFRIKHPAKRSSTTTVRCCSFAECPLQRGEQPRRSTQLPAAAPSRQLTKRTSRPPAPPAVPCWCERRRQGSHLWRLQVQSPCPEQRGAGGGVGGGIGARSAGTRGETHEETPGGSRRAGATCGLQRRGQSGSLAGQRGGGQCRQGRVQATRDSLAPACCQSFGDGALHPVDEGHQPFRQWRGRGNCILQSSARVQLLHDRREGGKVWTG